MPVPSDIKESHAPIDQPVTRLSGIGKKRALQLAALNIVHIRDLLMHLPRDYRDHSCVLTIAEAENGAMITIEAEITEARTLFQRRGKSSALLRVQDASGSINVMLYGRGFLINSALKPGTRCLFTGKVGEYKGPALLNPDYEPISEDGGKELLHTGRVVPIYTLTEGISQRQLRKWMHEALQLCASAFTETIPSFLREQHQFLPLSEAFHTLHFPPTIEAAKQAQKRFVYEELLSMQAAVLQRRQIRVNETPGFRHQIDGPLLKAFQAQLPFPLTPGQHRAVEDIFQDMNSPHPMFRLLQGDVGSGKTIAAVHAVLATLDSGLQTAFMAPTEILAEQHFRTLASILNPLKITTSLLTGATGGAARIRKAIAEGAIQVVVGTHALFQEHTRFARLGLVVIDEQHRFGVRQRTELSNKGIQPDVLHTTATPIPRSLALTLYGGMDISVIPDMPPGRLPVKTSYVSENKKYALYQYLHERAGKGEQSYIICPLIEESEHFTNLTPVISHFETLSSGSLKGLRCELLHGRLDAGEKDAIMTRFRNQEIDVLFSTTVIEVGVDSPTATTMVIEDAGRFGLTQLHQLRGRVGRSTIQSYCFLLGAPETPEAKKRIELLCSCTDGFKIAEADLELRGSGEYAGLRQSGVSNLDTAILLHDMQLLDTARRDAAELLKRDPQLQHAEHAPLVKAIRALDGMFV